MKTIITLGISVFAMVMFSCNTQKASSHAQKQDSTKTLATDIGRSGQITGNDRDEHGCIPSAGYQWSTLKQACIRPFDLSRRMKDLNHTALTGFMLFSDDNKQVEIFAADFKPAVVLSGVSENVYATTDQQYKLEKDANGKWVLNKTVDGKTTPVLQQ